LFSGNALPISFDSHFLILSFAQLALILSSKIAGVGCKIVAQFEEKQPNIIVNTLRSSQHRDKSYHLGSICNRQQELTPMRTLVKLIRDESGATAIEYGLIAAGISIAIIATVNALGTQLNTTFNSVSTALK
jgi:pilus assembly protein Flp/PilA